MKKHTCSECETVETMDIAPTGHEWEEEFTVDKEATCTTEGSKSIHCKHCEAVKDTTSILANSHTYNGWECDVDSHWQECMVCGEKTTAKSHAFQWIIDQEPIATSSGSKHEECSVCHYKKEAVAIPPITSTEIPGENTPSGDTENGSELFRPDDPPKTGDTSNVWFWIFLLALSTIGMGSTLATYKNHNYCEKRAKE